MMSYAPLQRRRREGLTDYRSRKKAITSRANLLVVRVSDKNVSSQFIKPRVSGDAVLSSAHSRQLRKLGWKGPMKSTPACYLLGLLAGKKASESGVKDAVLYMGVDPFVRGSRVAAFVKGVIDAGVSVPMGEEALPSEERLTGKSTAEFAARLAKEDEATYNRRFSALIGQGFRPEDYPEHVEKVKGMIMSGTKG